MSSKQTARIERWVKHGPCLTGVVLDHPKQETFSGHIQVTSRLLWIDEEARLAETENTIYALGEPYHA